jgi:predicted O-methyltransferase YrrM
VSVNKIYETYVSYCRTKHVMPANWDFYWRRRGLGDGIKNYRLRRRLAAKLGHRVMYLPSKEGLPWEFIRLDPWEMTYLAMAAAKAKKGIVEIGRYNGGSTLVMAAANRKVPIFSIDVAPQDDSFLHAALQKQEVGGNITLITRDSQQGNFPEIKPGSYDLVFVDGDHSFRGCFADLQHWWPQLASGGSALLHDCYYGSEVQDAVEAFFAENAAKVMRGANIPAVHWLTSHGSMAHFVKAS